MRPDSFADSRAISIVRLLTSLVIYFLKNRPCSISSSKVVRGKLNLALFFVFLCCIVFYYGCMFGFVVLDLVF